MASVRKKSSAHRAVPPIIGGGGFWLALLGGGLLSIFSPQVSQAAFKKHTDAAVPTSTTTPVSGKILEQPATPVRDVVVRGADRLAGELLAPYVAALKGRPFSYTLSRDFMRTLVRLYESGNIYGTTVELDLQNLGKGVLVFKVTEPWQRVGSPEKLAPPTARQPLPEEMAPPDVIATVDRVVFEGMGQVEAKAFIPLTEELSGQPYDFNQVLRAMRHIKTVYKNNWLPIPDVQTPLELSGEKALIFKIREKALPTGFVKKPPAKAGSIKHHVSKKSAKKSSRGPDIKRFSGLKPHGKDMVEAKPGIYLFRTAPRRGGQTKATTKRGDTRARAPSSKADKKLPRAPDKPFTPTLADPESRADGPIILSQKTETAGETLTNGIPLRPPPGFGDTANVTHPEDFPDVPFVTRPEEESLILELVAEEWSREEALIAYMGENNTLWVPLGQLAAALGFPIQVTPGEGTAAGWFAQEGNTFALNLPAGTLFIRGEEVTFSPKDLEVHYDDIYIKTTRLSEWFALKFNLNFNELRLYVSSDESLPFIARKERRNTWERLRDNVSHKFESGPLHPLPPQMYAPPLATVNLQTSGSKADGSRAMNSTASLQAQGDIFNMTGNLNAVLRHNSGEQAEFSSFRATLSRTDPESNLLGPLRARTVQLGDVDLPTIPLLSGSQRGRGLVASNSPVGLVRDPNNFDITGDAPVGWDVELYHNNNLVDFQTVNEEGRYEFTSLPLRTGINRFRTVIYGPNGERQEKMEEFFLGQGVLPPGKIYYDAGLVQSPRPLFSLEEFDSAHNTATFLGQVEYGLNRNISLVASGYKGSLYNREHSALGMGMRGTLGALYSQFNFVRLDNDAHTLSLDSRLSLFKTASLSANYTQHDGFTAADEELRNSFSLRWDDQVFFGHFPAFNYSFTARRRAYLAEADKVSIANTFSSNLWGVSWRNELEYEKSEAPTNSDTLYGEFTMQRDVGRLRLNSRLDYDLKTNPGLRQVVLRTQKKINGGLHAQLAMIKQFQNSEDFNADLTLNWKMEKYTLGVSLGGSDEGTLTGGVSIGTTLVPEKADGSAYRAHGKAASIHQGLVSLRAFTDYNENRVYDAGEPLLEGVEFRNINKNIRSATDGSGVAMVGNLTPYVRSHIEIMSKTLPDIYLQPFDPRISVVARPGYSGIVDYPVRLLGEVSGTILFDRKGTVELAENIPVRLINLDSGKVVDEIKSEYDGFYIFPSLPMGNYRVEVFALPSNAAETPAPIDVSLSKELPFGEEANILIPMPATTTTESGVADGATTPVPEFIE